MAGQLDDLELTMVSRSSSVETNEDVSVFCLYFSERTATLATCGNKEVNMWSTRDACLGKLEHRM